MAAYSPKTMQQKAKLGNGYVARQPSDKIATYSQSPTPVTSTTPSTQSEPTSKKALGRTRQYVKRVMAGADELKKKKLVADFHAGRVKLIINRDTKVPNY